VFYFLLINSLSFFRCCHATLLQRYLQLSQCHKRAGNSNLNLTIVVLVGTEYAVKIKTRQINSKKTKGYFYVDTINYNLYRGHNYLVKEYANFQLYIHDIREPDQALN